MCYHLVCGGGETKSQYKFYAGKKKPKKRKGLGHQMMHGKTIWKSENGEIAKPPGVLPLNPSMEAYSAPYKPPNCKGQCVDARWVSAYGHKTQSFMKNGGQQKHLDKALSPQTIIVNYLQIAHKTPSWLWRCSLWPATQWDFLKQAWKCSVWCSSSNHWGNLWYITN